jgi:hypothetical protein
MVYVQGENENRAMETVEKHNCRFSTVTTAPTAANKSTKRSSTEKHRAIVYTKSLTLPTP